MTILLYVAFILFKKQTITCNDVATSLDTSTFNRETCRRHNFVLVEKNSQLNHQHFIIFLLIVCLRFDVKLRSDSFC